MTTARHVLISVKGKGQSVCIKLSLALNLTLDRIFFCLFLFQNSKLFKNTWQYRRCDNSLLNAYYQVPTLWQCQSCTCTLMGSLELLKHMMKCWQKLGQVWKLKWLSRYATKHRIIYYYRFKESPINADFWVNRICTLWKTALFGYLRGMTLVKFSKTM